MPCFRLGYSISTPTAFPTRVHLSRLVVDSHRFAAKMSSTSATAAPKLLNRRYLKSAVKMAALRLKTIDNYK